MHMEFNAATDFTRLVWAATHPIKRLAGSLGTRRDDPVARNAPGNAIGCVLVIDQHDL
jgi:hypothetical protein